MFSLSSLFAYGDTNAYDAGWSRVQKALSDDLPQTALKELSALQKQALSEGNMPQLCRVLFQTMQCKTEISPDSLQPSLDAIQAAVLNVKLTHFEEELCKRRENAAKYDAFFANVEGIQPQRIAKGNTSTYAQYTLLVDDRNAFIEKLKKAEIPYCIHYPMALHCQPCFGELSLAASATDNLNSASENATLNCATGNATLNCAEVASTKAISLPVCAFTDVDTIIEKLRNVL